MASKKTTSKKKEPAARVAPPDLAAWFKKMYQRGILGVLVLLVAILTFVGLVQEQSGFLIDWWSGLLLRVLGWGSYVVTLVIAAAGVLILAAKMPKRSEISWHVVVGAEVILIAALSLTHLVAAGADPWAAARAGRGGGYVGAVFSNILSSTLGPVAAGLIWGVVLLWGALVVSGLTFDEWAERIETWIDALRGPAGVAEPEAVPDVRPASSARPRAPAAVWTAAAAGQDKASPQPAAQTRKGKKYRIVLPPLALLDPVRSGPTDEPDVQQKKRTIEVTLSQFGVPAEVVEINRGPMVTQFGVEPGYVKQQGQDGEEKARKVRVATIAGLSNDLSLALSASPIRIEAPIPGRSLVGIEVPNGRVQPVSLRQVVEAPAFQKAKSNLMLALGGGVAGTPVVADLARMPHLLIAGMTGSGKSVCLNAMAASLLLQNSPLTLRLLMIDPKRVEMTHYEQLPHLYGPVESDVERVVGVLHWLVNHMQWRYQRFAQVGARHLTDYNQHWQVGSSEYLPRIVVIIDELADLMLFAPEDVEKSICRLAQMARATGIHLVVATQRPSVDVVTGLIKANFPARIGFAVSSGTDSRVILDAVGAETLLGKGDMLYMSPESSQLTRAQGCFVSDAEIERIVQHWQAWAEEQGWQREPAPWDQLLESEKAFEGDDLIQQAIEIVHEQQSASASMLQRRMRIGYPRAARLIDELEELGVIGPAQKGGRAREVLDLERFDQVVPGSEERNDLPGDERLQL